MRPQAAHPRAPDDRIQDARGVRPPPEEHAQGKNQKIYQV